MFLSRLLILPAVIAALAFTNGVISTASANDDKSREESLDYLADHLLEVINRAHRNPALLDHAFFESIAAFGPDDYVQLAFYRALAEIDWYRNHDARNWVYANQPHYFQNFMDANQVTVFLEVVSGDDQIASMVADMVAANLPPYAVYSNDPDCSDMIISLRLGDMVPEFRERSRKPKSKKYKKAYRTKPPVDQQIHFANYTKVKERVIVALAYEFEITAGALRISLERSSVALHDSFSYGVDYQAYGAAGPVEDVPFPSKKVHKLVTLDPEATRREIARRLVARVAERVATILDYEALPLRSELRGRTGRR